VVGINQRFPNQQQINLQILDMKPYENPGKLRDYASMQVVARRLVVKVLP
jgi:hypothetical protein